MIDFNQRNYHESPQIDLPTKKLGDKMDDINEIARNVEMKEPGCIKVLISGTEDKIIVFGKKDVVQWTHDEISNILGSGYGILAPKQF